MKRTSKAATPVSVNADINAAVLRRTNAARYVGMPAPSFDKEIARGKGPPKVRLAGDSFGFRVIDLDAWIAARVESPERAA